MTCCSRSSVETVAAGSRRARRAGPATAAFLRGVPGGAGGFAAAATRPATRRRDAAAGARPGGAGGGSSGGEGGAGGLRAMVLLSCCGGANRARRRAVLGGRQEQPRRRRHRRQRRCRGDAPPSVAQPPCRLPGQRAVVVGGPGQHRDRHQKCDIRSQRFQRGSCTRLSAPISQTNRTRGKRRRSAAQRGERVARAERRLDRRSRPPAARPRSTAPRRAAPAAAAMPRRGFSGLPGETSSQTWSQPQPPPREQRDVAMPGMGRIERSAEQADPRAPPVAPARERVVQGRTWPLPVSTIAECGELLEPDRAAGMDAPGRDADLGAEPELPAVAELRRGVPQRDRAVDAGRNCSAAAASSVMMASVCSLPWRRDMGERRRRPRPPRRPRGWRRAIPCRNRARRPPAAPGRSRGRARRRGSRSRARADRRPAAAAATAPRPRRSAASRSRRTRRCGASSRSPTRAAPSPDRRPHGRRCGKALRHARAPAPAPLPAPARTRRLPPRGMMRSISPAPPSIAPT